MKRVLNLGVTLTLLALLVSCGVSPVIITDGRLQVAPGEPVGHIVGTIGRIAKGREKTVAGTNELRIRNVASGATFSLNYSGDGLVTNPKDIEEDGRHLAAFRVPLPPGDYEIYKVYFFRNTGLGTEEFSNAENFSLPIAVEAGAEVYLGEIVARTVLGKNLLGLTADAGYRFDFDNRRERDFAVIKARFPDFAPERARVYIPAKALILDRRDFIVIPVEGPALLPTPSDRQYEARPVL